MTHSLGMTFDSYAKEINFSIANDCSARPMFESFKPLKAWRQTTWLLIMLACEMAFGMWSTSPSEGSLGLLGLCSTVLLGGKKDVPPPSLQLTYELHILTCVRADYSLRAALSLDLCSNQALFVLHKLLQPFFALQYSLTSAFVLTGRRHVIINLLYTRLKLMRNLARRRRTWKSTSHLKHFPQGWVKMKKKKNLQR